MGIRVEYLGDRRWMVLEEFTILGVTVPKNFIYDGASTPRFLWSILPPMQETAEAACLHDYLCRIAKGKEDKALADKMFYRALRLTSMNRVRCILGYLGVRIGGLFGAGIYY